MIRRMLSKALGLDALRAAAPELFDGAAAIVVVLACIEEQEGTHA